MYTEERTSFNVRKLVTIAAGAIGLLIILIVQPFTYENIDAGNVGIKINLYGSDRGVDNITLVTGRVWYNTWTTKVVEFPTYEQTVDYEAFTVTAKDNAIFTIDPKLNFAINESLVPTIYKKYRKPLPELQNTFIRNQVFDAYRLVANGFASDSLMSNREAFEKQVEQRLADALGKDGFVQPKLTSGINPPESMARMIEEKNASIQARLKAENEAKQAIAEGQVLKAKADAEATALLVKARAEAEANKLKQQSLTPLLVEMERIRKWDGKYPTTVAGNSGVLLGIK